MRDVPTEVIQEFLSREYRPFWLVEFTIGGTPFRITDCDVPIAVGGNLYSPRGFKIPAFRYSDKSMVDQIKLTIDNLDDEFTSAFVGGTPQRSAFAVKQIFLDSDYKPIGQVAGPAGHWKFDEGLGETVLDFSGNENHGDMTGSDFVWQTDGILGGCLQITAKSGNYIDCGSAALFKRTGDLSLAGFIRLENPTWPDATTNYTLFTNETYQSSGFILRIGGSDRKILYRTSQAAASTYQQGNTALNQNQWYHVAIVHDSTAGTVTFYLDGSPDGSGSITDAVAATINFFISTGQSLYGKMDNFLFFDRVLTADEVADLADYQNGGYVGPGAISQFEGGLDAWTIDGRQLKVAAKSEMARWTQQPLSYHSISCRWKEFKGDECAYAGGESWCDRTYTRCEALGNTVNFGGFRWLPSIMDVEIWWGKIPS